MALDIQICMIPWSVHSQIYVTNAKSTQILMGCLDNRSLGHLRVAESRKTTLRHVVLHVRIFSWG